jgi:hypothetical protein
MLPRGLTADLAPRGDQEALKSIHPEAMTVVRILSGRCSCDLVRPRLTDSKDDERHLRERYRRLGIPRPAVITALERHRRIGAIRSSLNGGPAALANFVVEHARNAGPTLYLLAFDPGSAELVVPATAPEGRPLDEVRLGSDRWLVEGQPVIVG